MKVENSLTTSNQNNCVPKDTPGFRFFKFCNEPVLLCVTCGLVVVCLLTVRALTVSLVPTLSIKDSLLPHIQTLVCVCFVFFSPCRVVTLSSYARGWRASGWRDRAWHGGRARGWLAWWSRLLLVYWSRSWLLGVVVVVGVLFRGWHGGRTRR